jgi:hypothetical protein
VFASRESCQDVYKAAGSTGAGVGRLWGAEHKLTVTGERVMIDVSLFVVYDVPQICFGRLGARASKR